MTRLLLALLTLGAALAPAAPAQPPPAFDPKPARAAVLKSIAAGTIPGAVVAVTVAGQPVMTEAFGQATPDRPMTPDAIFRIASMTKPITSVAVLMLVEEGKLRLDDPVSRTLPEFAAMTVVGEGAATVPARRQITLRDLLTHTSGIAYGIDPPEPLKDAFAKAGLAYGLDAADPKLEANTKALAKLPLAHQPGTEWLYGMNTDVLGRVVEVASGKSLDVFFATRLFGPLKMPDTGFTVPPAKATRLVTLYTPGDGDTGVGRVRPVTEVTLTRGIPTVVPGKPLGKVNYLSGGGGLVSTAADYSRFLQMLVNGGVLDGVRLLKPETVRDMTRNQIGKTDLPFTLHGDKFGLGVAVTTKPGRATVGSYSWGGMYHTFFWVDPERKLTTVVMTQVWPWGDSTLWADVQKAVYAGLPAPAPAATDPDEQRRAAMNQPGDRKRGKELFASAALRCATCHSVDGSKSQPQGGVGPDLALVAGKLDKTHLIEAVLAPSAQILEGYRATAVTLADGRSLTGVVSGESDAGFTLRDVEGKGHAIAAGDVETRKVLSESVMPAGLCASVSPAGFADLVAYLETLRNGPPPSPGQGVAGAVQLPPGFTVEKVAGGLTGATTMTVAADGRVFVCEQTGTLRVVKDGKLLPEPFAEFPVARTMERGLLGVTTPPDFPKTPHVFVLYVAEKPYPHHVLSRLTAAGDRAEPGSEVVLFEGDDQTKLGGNRFDVHQGGPLQCGPDGKLYLGLGEQTTETPAQRLDTLLGKILRLNPDGSIPADNPFYDTSKGKYRAVWAYGCRNPFGMAVQPGTGRLFYNDVGGVAEEVNEVKRGANYGWPVSTGGPTADPRFTSPVHHYPTACITGGAFGPADAPWPAAFRGRYFYADFNHGFVRAIDPGNGAAAVPFASNLPRPTDLRFAANGDLYVLVRDAWLLDDQFTRGTGSLLRVRPPK